MKQYPQEFLDRLHSVTDKRPKTVIEHILKYGSITSQELIDLYGYTHPPRAIRDVRERGIPIETKMITASNGHRMAVYQFGDPSQNEKALKKTSGRTVLTKALKCALIEKYGSRCAVYLEPLEASRLQVDHRIPYEIGGEQPVSNLDAFMLLSPSANRAKSWSCEHCKNWLEKDAEMCLHCFWAYPENYDHIAGRYERVIHICFSGEEIEDYNQLLQKAADETAQNVIKALIKDYVK